MRVATVLMDAFDRIRDVVNQTVEGLSPEQLAWRVDGEANSIAWLIWHLTRIQDDHIADVAGGAQVWSAEGWSARFGLPFDKSDTGYGHSSDEVAAVRADAGLLTGYHNAVHERTVRYVSGLVEAALDRVVDTSWDPLVTLGVRLVSVISDDLQHAGQAAYVRGYLQCSA